MRQPEGSPVYWKSVVQWYAREIQEGRVDAEEYFPVLYAALLKLKQWEIFLGQKDKARKKNRAAKAARKRNRRR